MIEQRTLLSCGEHAVLVEVGRLDDVLAFVHAVREATTARDTGFTDIVDVVPAAATVLVIVSDQAPIMGVASPHCPSGLRKRHCPASSGLRSPCNTTGPISPRSHSAPGSAFGRSSPRTPEPTGGSRSAASRPALPI